MVYKKVKNIAFLACLFSLFQVSASEPISAKLALEKLIQGNQRYVNSSTVCHEDWSAKRAILTRNQTPFAVIVCCSDSRVPPEIIFDQTLGALFIVRVAGNVVDEFALGSVEYGVKVLGANLILVLGHTGCGAVDAALKGLKFDNHIQDVLNAIEPAVVATRGETGNLLEKTIKANVRLSKDEIKSSNPVLAELIQKGTVSILGGFYDLESGKVEFFEKL